MFLVCFATVIVAIKSDKTPRKKQQRISKSQASSLQELTTNIQIDHTTHNAVQGSSGTLEPSAPSELVHYGNANPSSDLETHPPSYTLAVRDNSERPYLTYGNDNFGMD